MLVKTTDFDVSGNMPGQSVDMSLSGDSLAHIMDILSDLYSDRPAAIVREYTTNALDAHIISGQTKPVKISTPNRLAPNLVIQDFGPGMSKQTLIDTYSKYGASTKRDNNLEAGQLGLGSKSGFAYTDQFTVRSVHDGHCCELIMSRNDRGAAEMTIAFDYPTDAESGLTITIPVKSSDISLVGHAVEQFAEFATPGTISVDGKINEHPSGWEKLSDDVYMVEHRDQSVIVMGNVAYPVNLFADVSSRRWSYNKKAFICFVEMGAIDFVPSREDLKLTNHTKKTVNELEKRIRDLIRTQISDAIDGSDDLIDKANTLALIDKWRDEIGHMSLPDLQSDVAEGLKDYRYKITMLPRNINNPNDKMLRNSGASSRVLNSAELIRMIDFELYAVTDFDALKVNRDHARRIIAANADFAGQRVHFFQTDKAAVESLFPKWKVMSWKDLKKIKIEKPKSTSSRTPLKKGDRYLGVMIHNRQEHSVESMMKTTGRAFYCSTTQLNELSRKDFPRGDFKLFKVIPSRQAAFKEANPHAQHLGEYVNNRRNQIRNHMASSSNIKRALQYAENPSVLRRRFDFSLIQNEEFLDKLKLAYTGYKWWRLSGGAYNDGGRFNKFLTNHYPLAYTGSYNDQQIVREHIALYINMIGEMNVNA